MAVAKKAAPARFHTLLPLFLFISVASSMFCFAERRFF
jgi:hypothetical protein